MGGAPQPSDRVDWAVAELESYASDGDAEALHHAPVA